MKNLVSTTARAFSDREKVERPWRVHLFVGEGILWRISLQVLSAVHPLVKRCTLSYIIMSLHKEQLFEGCGCILQVKHKWVHFKQNKMFKTKRNK
jgi:hypothetical protein